MILKISIAVAICTFIGLRCIPDCSDKYKTIVLKGLVALLVLAWGVDTGLSYKATKNDIDVSASCLISTSAYTEMTLSDEYFEFTDRTGNEHKIKKVDINALAFKNSPERIVRIYEISPEKYNIVVTKEDKTKGKE